MVTNLVGRWARAFRTPDERDKPAHEPEVEGRVALIWVDNMRVWLLIETAYGTMSTQPVECCLFGEPYADTEIDALQGIEASLDAKVTPALEALTGSVESLIEAVRDAGGVQ